MNKKLITCVLVVTAISGCAQPKGNRETRTLVRASRPTSEAETATLTRLASFEEPIAIEAPEPQQDGGELDVLEPNGLTLSELGAAVMSCAEPDAVSATAMAVNASACLIILKFPPIDPTPDCNWMVALRALQRAR